MELFRTRQEIEQYTQGCRDAGKTLGLVPTMGALHQGHLELVTRAMAENDRVIVSIFVNPTQFDSSEDLERYPRSLDSDVEKLRMLSPGVVVFAPDAEEMYQGEVRKATFDLKGLDAMMEGVHRDGHFQGVATIVVALLRLILPARAYFGEKDYQQLLIVRNLVQTEGIPVEIVPCPIVREADGLAMSSRNGRLTKRLRAEADFIHENLAYAKRLFGTKSAREIKEDVKRAFESNPAFVLEYIEIADAATLRPLRKKQKHKKYRAFIAAYLGSVRLIDNIALN